MSKLKKMKVYIMRTKLLQVIYKKKCYVTIAFFSSLSSAVLCVQRFMGIPSKGKSAMSIVMAVACVASWCIGAIFGAVPVVYDWIRWVKLIRDTPNTVYAST